jgi:TPR repeat protein
MVAAFALAVLASAPVSAATLDEAIARSEQLESEGRFAESAAALEPFGDQADGDLAFRLAHANLMAVVDGLHKDDAATADVSKARKWIDRAIELGNPAAYQLLYMVYQRGFGVPADMDKAVEYLRLGVAQEDPGAKANLALLAYEGIPPVEKDVNLAAKYFLELARGDPPNMVALYYLGVIAFKGEAGHPKDEVAGVSFIETAANHGVRDAQRDMGKALEYGWAGRKVDLDRALGYYAEAAEHGDTTALWRIGLAHVKGELGKADDALAVRYFREAAEAGGTRGMTSLGVMYATGAGVPMDYAQAKSWYEKAAEAGNTTAMKNLAVMYYEGQGVEVDLEKALSLATRARDDDVEGAADLVKLIEAKRQP